MVPVGVENQVQNVEDRNGLAKRAAQTKQNATDHAASSGGQNDLAQSRLAVSSKSQRCVDYIAVHLAKDFSSDRGDNRHNHHGYYETGDEWAAQEVV